MKRKQTLIQKDENFFLNSKPTIHPDTDKPKAVKVLVKLPSTSEPIPPTVTIFFDDLIYRLSDFGGEI